jgi:hypothetical protein
VRLSSQFAPRRATFNSTATGMAAAAYERRTGLIAKGKKETTMVPAITPTTLG